MNYNGFSKGMHKNSFIISFECKLEETCITEIGLDLPTIDDSSKLWQTNNGSCLKDQQHLEGEPSSVEKLLTSPVKSIPPR